MHLLSSLSFFVAHFDIILSFGFSSTRSIQCYHQSPLLWQLIQATPSLSPKPTLILPSAFELLSPYRMDCTSPHYPKLFQQTLSFVYQMPFNYVNITPDNFPGTTV